MVHSVENSEDGDSRFLQSTGTNLQYYTALLTRPLSSFVQRITILGEPDMLIQIVNC